MNFLTNDHPFVFFFGLLAATLLIMFAYHLVQAQRWQQFARRHQLDFVGGMSFLASPVIKGRYRGIDVLFRIVTRGYGRNKRRYTVIDAFLRYPPSLGLKVYREGLLSKLGKAVGAQDIQLGDEDFDKKVMIKGDSEEAVRRYLQAGLRGAILAMIGVSSNTYFDDPGAHFDQRGWVADPRKLKTLLDSMVACCLAGDKAWARINPDKKMG